MATTLKAPSVQPDGSGVTRAVVGWAVAVAVVAGLIALGVGSGVCEQRLSTWVQLMTTGLTLGAIYAMIALGYTMVYGVLQLLNFAHSEVFMIGTFAGLYTTTKIFGITDANHPNGLSGLILVMVIAGGILFAGLASGATAVAIERVAYRPLRRKGASRLGFLISAIGVSLFLSNLFLLLDGGRHLGLPFDWPNIAGRGPRFYPNVMPVKTVFTVFGVHVQNRQILVILVAVAMLVVLDLFVNKTRAGKGIRAVAEDPETASLMGVNITAIIVMTFFVGGLMAGGAGMLYGVFFGQAQFNIGFIP